MPLLRRSALGLRPIKLGIIGTGEIVRMVTRSLRADSALRVTAVAGTNPTAALRTADEFPGAVGFCDYREMLQADVDAVFIATPPHRHCEMVLAAIEAGKHVVCEKPLVISLDELRRLTVAGRERPDLAIASCSSRFHCCPPARRARDLIAAGELGDLITVRLNTSFEFPRPINEAPAWKQLRGTSGGGLLMDWGVYDLDWLQFVLGPHLVPDVVMGATSTWLSGAPDLETSYQAFIRCCNGLTISLTRGPEHGPRFQRAEIRGSKGGLDIPFMPGIAPHLTYFRRIDSSTLGETEMPERMNGWEEILAYPVIDLVHALQEGREVASPLAQQGRIYTLIAALYESCASGKSVPLAPLMDGCL